MSSSSQQNDSKRVDYFEWYLAWGYIVVKLDVPSNIGIRMLDLKNHVSTFLKSEYAPDSSEGSVCEDHRCKALQPE